MTYPEFNEGRAIAGVQVNRITGFVVPPAIAGATQSAHSA